MTTINHDKFSKYIYVYIYLNSYIAFIFLLFSNIANNIR